MEFESRYRPAGVHVIRSIQTNGMLLDASWADFFRENCFLVGISIDGSAELHNINRVDTAGKGTFSRASAAFSLMQRSSVDTNILCVVTGQTARRAGAVYAALRKMGCRYMQFIPCLDPLGAERGNEPFSLRPERYATFLKTLFDLWYKDWKNGDYVSVRLFDDYVHILAGRPTGSCASNGSCGSYIVVESDGSLYPCDFYTYERWRLGNIGDGDLASFLERGKTFIEKGAGEKCASCKYFHVCRGGCKRDRFADCGENYYCPAFIEFFDHAMERLMEIASLERLVAYEGKS